MTDFKVGDRVKYKYRYRKFSNKIGTIIYITDNSHEYQPSALVEFDNHIGGHDGGGAGKDGHCWWFYSNSLELTHNVKIDQSEMEKFL